MTRAGRRLGALGVVAGVGFVLRVHQALAPFETTDERNWTMRSAGFARALTRGDFASASASTSGDQVTMPGVTTMWIGTVSRGVWAAGAWLGLWSDHDTASYGGATDFAGTRSGLNVAQVGHALAVSVLLLVVLVLLDQWLGRTAALVAGLLLATEPFLVAHGAVLHTDELLGLFGVAALVTTALALGLPRVGSWSGRPWVGALAGVFVAGALLTKLSALLLGPSLALLVVWALFDPQRRRWVPWVVGAAVVACLVTVVAAYPALWADPSGELSALRDSASLGEEGHVQFFRGKTVDTPGPLYYLVAMPLRATPWLLVGGILALVALAWWPATRTLGLALAVMAAPWLVGVSLASKQLDRYGIHVVMLAAVACGAAASFALDLGRRRVWLRPALGVAAAAVVVHAAVVSPWGLAYFNPLLGGSDRAEKTVLIGWGEGFESAGPLVAEQVGGRCDGLTVRGYQPGAFFRCGVLPRRGTRPDYVLVYVSGRQRFRPMVDIEVDDRELVARHVIRGITYLELYGPPAVEPAPPAEPVEPAEPEPEPQPEG